MLYTNDPSQVRYSRYAGGGPKKNKTSLNAAEHGGVGEGHQCLFPRPSTVSSETDIFL